MRRHRFLFLSAAMALALLVLLPACSSYKQAEGEAPRQALINDAEGIALQFKERDPSLQRFFDTAYGYAVFPKVTKGGAGIGAAHGHGVVFAGGVPIGYTELSQVTLGPQLGGQTYSEIVFFEDAATLDVFKRGATEFAAQASAVAAEDGGAANADFAEGVAVFTMVRDGLMAEAAIGGQKFSYRPLGE